MPSNPDSHFKRPLRFGRGSVAGAVLSRALKNLASGTLAVELPGGEHIERVAARPGPSAVLILHRWRAVRRLMTGGQLGFAEAYIDGDWSSPDLASLVELVAVNQDHLAATLVPAHLPRLLALLQHWTRANTKRGSRRNIEAHYDLGNEFYAAWLDRDMSYSSAFFRRGDETLEDAQAEKQSLVMRHLALTGGERVLEIGCGWGGLAERLIREAGCHVTGVTLSPAQLEHASRRLALAGLESRADLRLQDYRDLVGTFDRIVSIEMLEAVGAAYWPVYFARLRDCLDQGGRAVLQVITIAERYYDNYRRDPDFIQRHIFPGGMLPSVTVLRRQIDDAGLCLRSMQHFGQSYAATLAEWQRRFQHAWPSLRLLGFDDAFKRKWEYYLAYCEGGFRAGAIDVGLYELTHAVAS
jgi:cyclopropane-fatty-acyl-phospholipid synthase